MTGLLHEKEFSRTSFVKGGGALIVGFSILGSRLAATARGGVNQTVRVKGDSPYASNPIDQNQVDSWLTINADNTAWVKSGAIFQGTGSETGILMIAAEELGMDLGQMALVQDDTDVTPNTGQKDASNTIVGGAGRGTRAAAAWARQTLLGLAATHLGVPISHLSVSKGVVSNGGRSVTYGQLIGGRLFNVTMPAEYDLQQADGIWTTSGLSPGVAPAKPVSQYAIVGTSPPRIDIPGIATGTMTYIQNVHVPRMLHGRVVRPRGQRAYGMGAPIVSVDASSVAHIPAVRVLKRGNFIGVVAKEEYDAIQAAALLKVKWADPPAALPGNGNEFGAMRALDRAGKTVHVTSSLNGEQDAGDVDRALASAAHVVAGTYGWPTNVHTPIGPQCSIADVTPNGARILSGTQGTYTIRDDTAPLLGLPPEKVRVSAFPMGGCFGDGSQYRDTAEAAAVLSQMAGAPVRVQLMRWDEIGWDGYAPATLMDIRAGIDRKGNLVAYDTTQYYPQYEQESVELTGLLTGTKLHASYPDGYYWPASMYQLTNNRYQLKAIPSEGQWVNGGWMRAGSSPLATFAGEQVIDQLAYAAKMDPVAFRLQNMIHGDGRRVLLDAMHAVTKAAKWQPKIAASSLSDANTVTGRGFAWSNVYLTNSPTAAIADVEVNKATGKVIVKHVYCAFSAGLLVNPGLVENQVVGGVTQIVSRVMVEQLRYSKTNVTSTDFITYPLLRFREAPKVTAIVLQYTGAAPNGVGEPVTVAAPAAVANAFFDATGVRLLTAPFTPARVREALKAAGVT
jgi:CO/xanthine dehydrogenase Mo-binding subunit